MITLLKNLDCYTPKHIGKQDILLTGNKIYKIRSPIKCMDTELIEKIIDCEGLTAFPALIDGHVHITGGGGEEGFQSQITPIKVADIFGAGVATLVGLLGADGCTRNLESLYAKAKSLQAEGLSTYIYSGSYSVPPVTFTGDIVRDLVLIDKVIGLGEIAVSDHRSSHSNLNELLKIASDTHLGGLLSGKAGIVHLHMGDGKEGLTPLFKIIEQSDLPKEMFVPTHVNRNGNLFEQAIEFCKNGGNIDLTSGETAGISVPDAVVRLQNEGVDMGLVTISSDANGSIPNGGVSSMSTLYGDIARCIKEKQISPETAFSLATEHVAKRLKLYPNKGTICQGSDADLLITDKDYTIKKLFCSGKLLLENN